MFLIFQTTGGPVTVNMDHVESIGFNPEDEVTTLHMASGGEIHVLDHPKKIRSILRWHTSVETVQEGHTIAPMPEEPGVRVKVYDPRHDEPIAEWETSDDGSHKPS